MAAWPYNSAQWKRLRNLHLSLCPMCEPCQRAGRKTIANTVDHKVAISEGGAPFPGPDGLESMCAPCHSAKTARGGEAGAARTTQPLRPRKGCDRFGQPLDPAHPWNRQEACQNDEKIARSWAEKTAPTENTQLVAIDTKSGGGNG